MTDIETVAIDSLTLYPGNYRQGDIGAIAESIEANGWYGVVIAHRDTRRVLAGNHRIQAATAVGMTSVPVYWIDGDEEQSRRILIADNRTSDLATNDEVALAEMLKELNDADALAGTGFDAEDLMRMLDDVERDALTDPTDPPPTAPEQAQERWNVEPGDVWTAGDHIIVCGSATDPDSWEATTMHGSIDAIVTSPPYNQGIDKWKPSGMQKETGYVGKVADLAYSDSLPEDEYQSQQRAFLDAAHDALRDTGSIFYNHKNRYRNKRSISPLEWLPGPFTIRQEITWARGSSIAMNARMMIPADERIYWMYKGDDFTFVDTTEHKSFTTVWQFGADTTQSDKHSVAYPLELPRRCIVASTKPGETVCDPYAGTGTTIIAAHNTNRRGIAIELDPKYVAVTLDRLATLDITPTRT